MTRLLIASLAAVLLCASACEPGPNTDIEDRPDDSERRTVGSDVSQANYPELEVPVPASENLEYVEFKLGSTEFRAPRKLVGFYVGKNGDEVDYTTLQTYVPMLLQRDSLPTREDAVLISIQVRNEAPYEGRADCYTPVYLNKPMSDEQAEAHFECVFGHEKYHRKVDSDLGLLRLAYEGRQTSVAYRRPDEYRRPNDGRIPFIRCIGTTHSRGWSCLSQGWLAPDIQVEYQIYEKQLRDWPEIDAAVFSLIDSYRLEDSSDLVD